MKYAIRLITGFFETSPYELRVCEDKLVLYPSNDLGNITMIQNGEITGVTLTGSKAARFEISAGDQSCQGFLQDRYELESFLGELRKNLSTRVLCQYEGGREHA